MTVSEVFDTVSRLLDELGYTSGDIRDDFELAVSKVKTRAPRVAEMEL